MTYQILFLVACLLIVFRPVSAADYEAGLKAFVESDYESAFLEWEPLAQAGHVRAQKRIGDLYFNGLGKAQTLTSPESFIYPPRS